MVKEVLVNEGTRVNSKSGETVYSEEAGNVLKGNTPEGEYIDNCNVVIKKVKDMVKENEKAVKEAKEQLHDVDTKKFVEKYAVKRLYKILSKGELRTIIKGRKWENLYEIIEEGKVDPLKDLIDKIFDGIENFSDDEKLIIAEYLGNKQIILVNMHQYDSERGNISCSVGWYYTDFESEINKVHEIQRNLDKLGLKKYIEYRGDSCYGIKDEFYREVREKAKNETLSNVEKLNKENFERLTSEGKNLNEMLESLEERKSAVGKYGLPENEAISLYQWSKELYGVHDEFYDKKNHTLVVLHEYSDYNGSGGSEYGTVISIKRGKNIVEKRFKYRDRYDSRNDNPRYEYRKIESVKVDEDKVEVTVSRGKSTDTYTFDIVYEEDKSILSSVEKKKFEESIRSVKEGLIVENTKDQKYPASYNLTLRKVPGAFDKDGMSLESELLYDKAKVVYENIISENEAHITILTQKDASGDMGRQFGLIKYIVTPKGAKKVDEYFYWELNQIEGNMDNKKMKEFSNW